MTEPNQNPESQGHGNESDLPAGEREARMSLDDIHQEQQPSERFPERFRTYAYWGVGALVAIALMVVLVFVGYQSGSKQSANSTNDIVTVVQEQNGDTLKVLAEYMVQQKQQHDDMMGEINALKNRPAGMELGEISHTLLERGARGSVFAQVAIDNDGTSNPLMQSYRGANQHAYRAATQRMGTPTFPISQ